MHFTKKTAALLLLTIAAMLGLNACQSTQPKPAAEDEHAGHTKHVHADGSVHYH
jgi:hypothetical protein